MSKVYLLRIENDEEVYFKIGWTSRDINTRVRELETGNPLDIQIRQVFETRHAVALESALHRMYAHRKHRDEWFTNIDENEFVRACVTLSRGMEILN